MYPERWNPTNLKRAFENPRLIEREVRMWISRATTPLSEFKHKRRYADGIDVMDEDWDNLVILDACRFDSFAERNPLSGELRAVTSQGSTSSEFIEGNFMGRELHDTVYVTANPYVEKLSDDTFYTVENLLIDRWEDDPGTVPPDAIREAAVEAHETYPNKRLIVHFMQPHTPYLGPTAREIRDRLGLNDGYNKYHCVDGDDVKLDGRSWFGAVMQGYVSHEELRRAYEETLDIAVRNTRALLSRIDGRSIVTADHGEFLGERFGPLSHRRYGHPADCYAPELREVPWLEIESAARRRTTAEAPIGFERLDEDSVDERLEALGYVSG